MSDYYDGRLFIYDLPFGEKGKLFYDNFYKASHAFLRKSPSRWGELVSRVNALFSAPYSEFENQSDPHLNLGLEGSLRTYTEVPTYKTRVFLVIQDLLRGSLVEEAQLILRTRGRRTRPKHLLPSPLFFLRTYLTDPHFPASEAYAHAILRTIIFAAAVKYYHQLVADGRKNILERTTGLPKDDTPVKIIRHFTSFELIVDSLRKIGLHEKIRDVTYPSNPADFIVMHMLASRGYLFLSFPQSPIRPTIAPSRRRSERYESRDDFLERGTLIGEKGLYDFRLGEHIQSLPPASEIVNEIDGLPIAIPNADIIFARGLRFTASEGTVLRLTGPSGGGKTSVALGFSIALAPLGIDTIYLSCEENEDDLERRIQTLVPYFIRRTETYRQHKSPKRWFQARHLREGPDTDYLEISRLVDDLVKAHGQQNRVAVESRPPSLTPLLIVVDGIHELLVTDRRDRSREGESRRLRSLVENLRRTGALVIIMSADFNDPAVSDLDYVADLVADIAFEKTDDVSQPLVRKFVLRKTRRQFARMGAHLLNLSPRVGISLTPQISAQRDVYRDFAWVRRSIHAWFDIFRGGILRSEHVGSHALRLYEFSQVLVTGRGSSGKASFALRLMSGAMIRSGIKDAGESNEDLFGDRGEAGLGGRKESSMARSLLVDLYKQPSQRRILVVSFLYQQSHYDEIVKRMDKLPRALFSIPRPELHLHTETFYPGHLRPEDFLRKVIRSLEVSRLEGMPYEAVVIDGLHNVFMQFPSLQESRVLWPVMYEMLRKFRVTVVTTHTHMEMPGAGTAGYMALDLDVARERAAPILQALVNASDFFFDISAELENRNEFQIHTVNASDQRIPPDLIWDRNTLIISAKRPSGKRKTVGAHVGVREAKHNRN